MDRRIDSRPTLRTDAVIDEICDGLRVGLTLQQICRRRHMPKRTTVWEWRQTDKALAERIALARAQGCEALAEQGLEIVDDASGDLLTDAQGALRGNSTAVARAKLRFDARLKLAEVWNRAEYGSKLDVSGKVEVTLEALVLASMGHAPSSDPPAMRNVTPAPAIGALPADCSDLL